MYELKVGQCQFRELAARILDGGSVLRFRAYGASMYPFIKDGDIIEVWRVDASAVRRGDVVLCHQRNGRIVVHRVVGSSRKNGPVTLAVQGDALTRPDGLFFSEQVLGRVVAVERKGKRIRLDTGFQQIAGALWVGLSPISRWLYRVTTALRNVVG